MIHTFRKGGIHPPDHKITAGSPIRELKPEELVYVMLNQSIGTPSKAVVAVGDTVSRGQMVGQPGGFVSAPVHSPVDGVVRRIERLRNPFGYYDTAVVIESIPSEAKEHAPGKSPSSFDYDSLSPQDIISAVGDAGIVGLGGAGFPTKVKLMPPKDMQANCVILNGAECEPCLTCDDALMRAFPGEIVGGLRLLMKAVGVTKGYIAIEDNKPQAIKLMKKAAKACGADVSVVVLKKKYPQGGEKQLIEAVLHKEVPTGQLPVATGAIVDNVATAFAVWDAIANHQPLIRRIVTVTGPELSNPGNFLVSIGTPINTLIEAAGGMPEQTGKIVAGGPMMGRAMVNPYAPVTKTLSGILVLPSDESIRPKTQPCIRCGSCVNACPMGLEPYLLAFYGEFRDWDNAEHAGVGSCIECGSCTYVCPSHRTMLDYIKIAKQTVGAIQRRRPKST